MTPGRRAWLQRLLDAPGTDDAGRPVTDCMILGWCRYAYRLPHSDVLLTVDDLITMFGEDGWGEHITPETKAGMVITKYGRQALARWP